MTHSARRVLAVLGLVLMAASLSACVVEDRPGGGWCYYHPYRCR